MKISLRPKSVPNLRTMVAVNSGNISARPAIIVAAMLGWACAVGILGLSARISCNSEFFYSQNIFRRSDGCNLCFEKDCLTIDKARCDYYVEADSILPKDEEDPGGIEDAVKRKEVDDLIFDMMDKGLSKTMECIPYVSRYTSCNKDNVCLDCKTCACNPEGKWNCTIMQPCDSQNPPLHIDHRVLVMIMEALTDNSHLRKSKRSVTDNPKDAGSTISLEQLSEWLYGIKPLNMKKINPREITSTTEFAVIVDDDEPASEIATVTNPTLSGLTTTEKTETTTSEDTDYIAFDEVLRSIAVDPTSYNRKMPLHNKQLDNIINNQTFSVDYMIMDEKNATNGAPNDQLGDVINFMLQYDDVVTVTESTVAGATEVIIDLLDTAGKLANVNVSEDFTNYKKDPSIFENSNDIMQYNALHIMKRDVTGQTQNITSNVLPTVTILANTTNTSSTNKTEEATDLQENVLIPLNKIITDKVSELESLQNIKTDLLKYVRSNSHPEDKPIENNATSKTYFSIYNVAMATGLYVDLRKANPSIYEKYMIKLKSDIFEVIRDITGIQKYKNSDLPEDLKRLMHAMKRYVYKNQLIKKPKRNKVIRQQFLRRNMEQTSRCDRLSYKDCLVKVIEVIDKDIPKSHALSRLSPASRNIIKNIIKSYYVDQLIMPGLRAYNPYYNLTVYLNSIGSKWQEVTANLISSTPFASLHRMKLLHCTLTLDISKLNDAIGIVEFAHSRRMDSTLDKVNDDTLDRINAGLTAIHNKILMLIKYYKQIPKPAVTKQPRAEIKKTTTRPRPSAATKGPEEVPKTKKRSFIKHIRSLLNTSKKHITDLLQRKVPKSEIVRQLAKKRLDEISEKRYGEYEETMRRWQKNLELGARMKRSVLDQFQARIKNIIPRYLRHKVNPRIKENQKNATANTTRKADGRKNKRKASRRERKSRKTATPRSRKPATTRARRVTTHPTAHATTTRARKPTTSTIL